MSGSIQESQSRRSIGRVWFTRSTSPDSMINEIPRRTHRQELWEVFWMIAPCDWKLNPRYWHLLLNKTSHRVQQVASACVRTTTWKSWKGPPQWCPFHRSTLQCLSSLFSAPHQTTEISVFSLYRLSVIQIKIAQFTYISYKSSLVIPAELIR